MKKWIITGALLLSAAAAFGQTRTVEHDFSAFDAVVASQDFAVALNLDSSYGAKLTLDDALEDFVKCYVKGRTLFIELDSKAVPKDLKKRYRGRNASAPVLNVTVYAPSLNSVTLSDQATFTSLDRIETDNFNVNLSGSSSVQKLSVRAKTATVVCSKKSSLKMELSADELSLKAADKAKAELECDARLLSVDNAGSAAVVLKGDADEVEVTTANSAVLNLSGTAASLKVTGSGGSSKIDASGLPVRNATVTLAGSELTVAVDQLLELDLSRGASVTYSGDPAVKIVRIQNASVLRK